MQLLFMAQEKGSEISNQNQEIIPFFLLEGQARVNTPSQSLTLQTINTWASSSLTPMPKNTAFHTLLKILSTQTVQFMFKISQILCLLLLAVLSICSSLQDLLTKMQSDSTTKLQVLQLCLNLGTTVSSQLQTCTIIRIRLTWPYKPIKTTTYPLKVWLSMKDLS